MKSPEEVKEAKSKLTPNEVSELDWIKRELEDFLKKEEVSQDGLKKLEAMEQSLAIVRRTYTARVLALMRSQYLYDD